MVGSGEFENSDTSAEKKIRRVIRVEPRIGLHITILNFILFYLFISVDLLGGIFSIKITSSFILKKNKTPLNKVP